MLQRIIILVLLATMPLMSSVAQELSESYYRENPSLVDSDLWLNKDDYYAMPQILNSPFEQYARWGFSFVSYAFRGEQGNSLTTRLGAIDVSSPLERYPNYTLLNLLRRIPAHRTDLWSNAHSEWGADVRSEVFGTSPSALAERHRLRLQLSSRSYRLGSYFSSVGRLDSLWHYSLLVGGRWGRDGNIDGVFTEEENIWLSAERVWGDGVEKHLQMALMVAPVMRSGRSWNTEEVFALSGNRHYNSYWGYQQGKVRSSRVRRECVPMMYASFDIDDTYLLSNLNVSALLSVGRKSHTTLDWADAPNPQPDYYLYLPSAQSDPKVELLAREVWLRNDERYTQIDWQGLYGANALSVTGARYALLEDREDVASAIVDCSVALLGHNSSRLGVRLSHHATNNYNLPSDLLGAPLLGEGFELYDYSVGRSAWDVYYTHQRDTEWGNISLAAEVGGESVGYYSKISERKAADNGWSLDAVARWSYPMEGGVVVGSNLRYARESAYWEDRFGAVEGAMTINPYSGITHDGSAEVWARGMVGDVLLHSTLFARLRGGSSRVEHFWNDLAGCYVALLAGDMNTLTYGLEFTLDIPLSNSFRATFHTAHLSSGYLNDAVGDVVSFDEGKPLITATPLRIKGRAATSSPLSSAALVVRYSAPYGWVVGAEWAMAARRNMEPALFLCSDYVFECNLSDEVRTTITTSQRIASAQMVDLFAYRNVGNFTFSLSINNILNLTNGYYDGYQPSRLRVRESDLVIDYSLHAPRYQHIYPRYFLMSVAYEF